MIDLVERHVDDLATACAKYRVARLDVFGSATRPDFRPDSDLDLLVDFQPMAPTELVSSDACIDCFHARLAGCEPVRMRAFTQEPTCHRRPKLKRMLVSTMVLLMAVLASCAPATVGAPVSRIPFPTAEYDRLPLSGVTTVSGQAFMRQRGGTVVTAAGSQVVLEPVTSYSQQWIDVVYVGAKRLTAADPRRDPYVMVTTADADGRFTFRNVPEGEHFVITSVTWETPTQYGMSTQGGLVAVRVRVNEGEDLNVIVSR